MTTALLTHRDCLLHEPPYGHPEHSGRLRAVLDAVRSRPIVERSAPEASREALLRVHAENLVDSMLGPWDREANDAGILGIDPDTFMSPGSAKAALHAAGAAIAAVDGVVRGEFQNAFCAVRPPGHHAERARAMGFCLFNSVAIGVQHARAAYGLGRLAIIDFDVHHGNGTQDIFFDDPEALYVSTHQMPLYPGTGFESERGVARNIVNKPLSPGSGSAEFREIYAQSLLPRIEEFGPDIVFISAGFDAHRADPLANLNLTEADFGWITGEICAVARRICGGRVVSALEGGYDLGALAASAAAHVDALCEA
ncbi:MAG: histone deacetylase family protein [Alphaproteobacteria bacterium]|nr:histone deacetylase family protein [Alphaproteobacteria bacterium]